MLVLELNSELRLFIYSCSRSKVKTSFNVIKPFKSKQTKTHEKKKRLQSSQSVYLTMLFLGKLSPQSR